MGENEIIILAGKDLFRMGMLLGTGVTFGVWVAITVCLVVGKALETAQHAIFPKETPNDR